MKTIQEVLGDCARRFQNCGLDSAHLDAELLLARILNIPREQLLTRQAQILTKTDQQCFQQFMRRRLEGEPVSYICRRAYFYGHELCLAAGVLQPRPETELLVDQALHWLDQQKKKRLTVADIGTGSGCIAVAIVLARPQVRLYATDISGLALKVAQKNIRHYSLEGRVTLLTGHLVQPLLNHKVDLLVANLPYGTAAEQEDWLPEVTREPARAIYGGKNGLELIEELLQNSDRVLRPRGAILLEINPCQLAALKTSIKKQGKYHPVFYQDLTGRNRVVLLTPTLKPPVGG